MHLHKDRSVIIIIVLLQIIMRRNLINFYNNGNLQILYAGTTEPPLPLRLPGAGGGVNVY